MNIISFNKNLNFFSGSIEVKYDGIPKNDVNLDRINMLLDDFINNHSHKSMIDNVSIIRTIMKDFEEKLLVIYYQDEKYSEFVKYDNSNLFMYKKNKKEEINNSLDRYNIKYEQLNGLKIDYNNHENDVVGYPGIDTLSKEIKGVIKQIYYLKNTKAIVLDTDDKVLIKIYKLFYDENPDFCSKDINIKVQTMMSILAKFGISLEDDYGFTLWEKDKIPLSLNLEQRVKKLYPLGEVNNLDNEIVLVDNAKNIIKIVGECVREAFINNQNQNDVLINISKIVHARRYSLSSNYDIKRISKYTQLKTDEVEKNMKLVKRIETKIAEQI